MSDLRIRAAMLGSLLPDPAQPLALAMRTVGVEAAWAAFEAGHRSIPLPMLDRFRALRAERIAQLAADADARIIVPGDAEWPVQLDDLGPARPWALWVRGRALPGVDTTRSVAIVGARSCTAYGERVASEFAARLGRAGTPVVSGGAYGIDAAAHRGALASGGHTVAVLACGVDVAYPPGHSALFERIMESGTIVGEALPGTHPTKPAFLVRNRLIAALSYGTVVVEARQRSGSLSTLAHARTLRRVLMAVPGSIDSAESAGTNALLQDDAALVTSGDDVLGLIAPLDSLHYDEPTRPVSEWDTLDPREQLVHESLPARRRVSVDAIADRLSMALAIPDVLRALASLSQRGLVVEDLDGQWRRVRALRGADA